MFIGCHLLIAGRSRRFARSMRLVGARCHLCCAWCSGTGRLPTGGAGTRVSTQGAGAITCSRGRAVSLGACGMASSSRIATPTTAASKFTIWQWTRMGATLWLAVLPTQRRRWKQTHGAGRGAKEGFLKGLSALVTEQALAPGQPQVAAAGA
jgi:hypothetical protein